jgi:hypothetical protein
MNGLHSCEQRFSRANPNSGEAKSLELFGNCELDNGLNIYLYIYLYEYGYLYRRILEYALGF